MNPEETNRLLARLEQSEDPWVERKASFDEKDVRKTLVGFANSVRQGEIAVLFIGARNDGNHPGVKDADNMQKQVAGVAIDKCYPPISYLPKVLPVSVGGNLKEILAIQVPFSEKRPHFNGLAYVRRGSETIEASEDVFRDLVASQNDKARRILQFKGSRCWLRLRSQSGFWYDLECTVVECDAHSVTLLDDSATTWSFPIERLDIQRTALRDLEIVASSPVTEEEHIRRMVTRWTVHQSPPQNDEFHLPSDWMVDQILSNPDRSLATIARLADGSTNLWLRILHLHVRFAAKVAEKGRPRHQKFRQLNRRFAEEMVNRSPTSNVCLISAAMTSILEVATSLRECEEFLDHLRKSHSGMAQVPYVAVWNAMLWELKL